MNSKVQCCSEPLPEEYPSGWWHAQNSDDAAIESGVDPVDSELGNILLP